MTSSPLATVDSILDFLATVGQAEYHGERVSQLEHALQAAHLARQDGGSDEEVIAALLHDIGHIWPDEDSRMTNVGVIAHDAIGARVLSGLGFSQAVTEIVSGHVVAKRYLVSADLEYGSRLSEASVESLRRQGGPMSSEEAGEFSRSAYFSEKVRVRIWDDRAKAPGLEVPGLESYRELLLDHLTRQQIR